MDANEQRYDWLVSQKRFHERKQGKWHKSQARWYRKAIRSVPGVWLIVIGRVFRKHSAAIAQNIVANNAFLERFRRAG